MGEFSFWTGIIGLLIGIPALFGMTLTLRKRFPWKAVLNGIKAVTPEIVALEPRWRPESGVKVTGAVPASW